MKPFKYNPNNHSGQFKHRITFQKFTEGTDADGFPIEQWEDVKALWSMIKTLKGSEYFAASSTQNETVSRFVIHYTEGLHPDMRILYKKKPTSRVRTFSIESIINDDETDMTMTIIVKEAIG